MATRIRRWLGLRPSRTSGRARSMIVVDGVGEITVLKLLLDLKVFASVGW